MKAETMTSERLALLRVNPAEASKAFAFSKPSLRAMAKARTVCLLG